MKLGTRTAIVLGTVACAALVAAQAFAAYAPKLTASTIGVTSTVNFTLAATDDTTAVLNLYSPADFLANTGALSGSSIGSVDAKFALADSGNSVVSATASLNAALGADQITSGATTGTLAQLATACNGGAPNQYLLATFSLSGVQTQVPVFVTQVLPGDPLSDNDIASYRFRICLPPSDVPVGTAGRSPFGAKLVSATVKFTNYFTSLNVELYPWHSLSIPYTPATGKPAATGVEADSIDRPDPALTLKAKTVKKTVHVSGSLTSTNAGINGAKVQIFSGTKVVATVTTKGKGAFSATLKLKGHPQLSARSTVATRDSASCTQPAFAPAPCTETVAGGFTVKSPAVKG
jgi:hypothetical protein